MREVTFLRKNESKWANYEQMLQAPQTPPDQLAQIFVEISDDLAYTQTNYPRSRTAVYLNNLATQAHLAIYRNKKDKSNRFVMFWQYELPLLMGQVRWQLLYSFLFFGISVVIGALSTAYDDTFVRLILGDFYVNMTLENIRKGDPMAVYKSASQMDMFLGITFNNVMVSFKAFAWGLVVSVGTLYILVYNGIMLGSFQLFFYQHGLLWTSALTIWIHGTLEISAIVLAGCAGLVMGNSILFPGTYSRLVSFRRGAQTGLKIVIGLVPIFILAGFLESFVTRLTGMPDFFKLLIIGSSAFFIVYYFVIYPMQLRRYSSVASKPKEVA
ncbi:MAG: stage II sporulation protein M [Microscillaceae bacterium]|jgi:uncharacterized membrane protein SpoIIM required for sporulation|nr:stage II sporulation protein M [Microscillaceae bacterium]